MVIGGKNKTRGTSKEYYSRIPTFTKHNIIVKIHDASPSIIHSTICVAIKKRSFSSRLNFIVYYPYGINKS